VEAASALEPFSEYVGDFTPWNLQEAAPTQRRLAAAGFDDIRCWLQQVEPILPEDPADYVAVVGLATHHERLPEELRDPFVAAVIEHMPDPFELRYVRLNIEARRPA
jgi:hypothetical protein